MLRQSQQGRMEEQRLLQNGNVNHVRNEDMMRYPSSNNIKSSEIIGRGEEMIRGEMRTSKSEDMLRQPTREEMLRYNSTNNIRTQDENNLQLHSNAGRTEQNQSQNEVTMRQHPVNASLRGQAKMAEMSEEVRRRQNRVSAGYNQYQPNASNNYQQYQQQTTNSAYYPQSPGMTLSLQQQQQLQLQQQQLQQQYYNSPGSQYQQQYQQPMSPSYTQASNAYNQPTANTSSQHFRSFPNNQQAAMGQTQTSMQNLSLNTSYAQNVQSVQSPGSYNHSSQLSPQSAYLKSPPTAPKPKPKGDELPPELPPSTTHPLYAASLQEPPKGAFYPSQAVQGKGGPANPWEREEREKVR